MRMDIMNIKNETKKILLLMIFVLTTAMPYAQNGKLLVKEGKTWVTMWGDGNHTYKFEGDTVINGVTYKKMYRDGNYAYSARQDGGKVYWIDKQYYNGAPKYTVAAPQYANGNTTNEELVMNFDLKEGDEIFYYKVGNVDTVTVNSVKYRRLHLLNNINIPDYPTTALKECAVWVDGIGTTDEPLTQWAGLSTKTPYFLLGCYDNGVKIFSAEDFYSSTGTDGVADVQVSGNNERGQLYDLSGRKLSTRPEQGMYISGGKKYVKK
jgi:hypothetical protein